MKYLSHVRPKMLPKLKMLRIYRNLAHLMLQVCRNFKYDISNMLISILMSFFLVKYLPIASLQLVPKWKIRRIYWNLVALIFQIWWSQFCCQKWFLFNIYQLLGLNWPKNSSIAGHKFFPESKMFRVYWSLA